MKPAEHPDFFRRPPPAGRSRESTLRIDAQGAFWHEGQPVEHPRLRRALARWLDVHPDDGRYVLNNGYDWSYVQVDAVPFFVRTVRGALPEQPAPDGASASHASGVWLELNDGSAERLRPETLSEDATGALYCRVKSGRFEAKFTPPAQLALEPWLVPLGDGVGLCVGGRTYACRPRA